MTKADFVKKYKENGEFKSGVAAGKALDAFIATVADVLKAGDKIALPGFGIFLVADRAARKGRNPQTGKEITIPATKVVKYTMAKPLKDSIRTIR
ncbi:MAG: HU family DNA-binding protein [Desulfovibrio sp.]|jgi:DNA-binding protein HU-beta|nr:HU family DNA-binding protein [Desulfovibrio sp.]